MPVYNETQTHKLNSNGFYGNGLMILLELVAFDQLIFLSVSARLICVGG